LPLQLLQLRPGVNREGTTLANEGGWFECDKVRFKSGYPQKIGGWVPLTSRTYLGVARALWNYVTLRGFNLLAIGTNLKYYIENGGIYYDITPIRYTSVAGDVTFSATDGSSVITVFDHDNGAIDGDFVTIYDAVSLGGNITAAILNQEYQLTYIDSNSYSITVPAVANSSDSGDGGVAAYGAYQLNIGPEIYVTENGWGAGLWGGITTNGIIDYLASTINSSVTTIPLVDATGFPATGLILIDAELITYSGISTNDLTGCTRAVNGTTAAAHTGGTTVYDAATFSGWGESNTAAIAAQLRLWSQDNFGEFLIFNPRNGGIYLWIPDYDGGGNITITNRGELLSPSSSGVYQTDASCPSVSIQTMVSDASRFVISFGCNDYGTSVQSRMLIRWSDQEDYQTWAPAITNQAGSYLLSSGSTIVTAIQSRQEIFILTDSAAYSMQYIGPPYVWGFNILSDNISIIGPNAITAANNIIYWMGQEKFYCYTGRVETLPCTLRQYVYGNINMEQSFQFFSGTNEGYSEVWWYYCSANSTVVDRYVIYNYLDKVWYYGNLERSAWLDSSLRRFPMAATYEHAMVFHEDGTDDQNISGEVSPIEAYIQSSDFDIGDGHNFGFVWRIIPDLTFDGSTTPSPDKPSAVFTVRPRQNPGAPYGTSDLPVVESAQSYANQRNYTVQEFTQIVYTRLRGRQMAFKISSDTLGTQWQLGTPRIDVRPDGRR
jgi:hypothetical protein